MGQQRHFEILVAVTALVDEHNEVPLATAAASVGCEPEELRRLLEPLLYLEFRVGGDYIDASRDFYLDPDTDILRLEDQGRHWLRDMRSTPPDHDSALRLLIAGTIFWATERPSPTLTSALDKLAMQVAAELVVPVARPEWLDVVQDASRRMRSLRMRYLGYGKDVPTDREMLPWRVYSRWGTWYVTGPDLGGTVVKHFRVTRMITAEVGTVDFEPPPEIEPPDFFDLTDLERTLTVIAPQAALDGLPQPCQIADPVPQADGRIRATVTIAGERQLDRLLISLGPEGEVVDSPELEARRREWAATLLERVV